MEVKKGNGVEAITEMIDAKIESILKKCRYHALIKANVRIRTWKRKIVKETVQEIRKQK